MIPLREISGYLEDLAPLSLQESYDNSGLQVGDPDMNISGVLVALDASEGVLLEAEKLGFNLVLTHHPVIFGGLKSLTGRSGSERIVKMAIQKEIAIYACHTNFDAVTGGVNSALSNRLGLVDQEILDPESGSLKKIVVFVPHAQLEQVRQAMFDAGAGQIGAYDSCSFNLEGKGTFRGGEDSNPFAGKAGEFHQEPETRMETIVPATLAAKVIRAMTAAHPYEEVAYDIYPVENKDLSKGMGMIGRLEFPMEEEVFLGFLKDRFQAPVVRHSALLGKTVKKVAVCGGAGSFLLGKARAKGADVFVTGDMKYHQFFEAEGKLVVMDIGHFESEQFTRELFYDLLMKKFSNFAVRLSETEQNPIKYF
jgi:dinuclear metal center YbgI/SA1388 family protein